MIAPDTLLQNRYLVVKQIGQGGMGAVYIATDQRFGSTVALKETFFTDPALRRAFEREARLLNSLRHSALPRVSDHFTEEEGQFLVMEYIAGDDLSEMLKAQGGAFPLAEVLDWADQLLDALDYLHTQQLPIIHRDIKPQNLKLTPRNHIVLLDFGLAKGTLEELSRVTATASVFGFSRNYAPLEQIQGSGTDPRSDLYSLAATLYHLVTGAAPPDALARATAVLNGQPDPLLPANEVHTQVTEAVARVLSSALAQNAGQRPESADMMRRALREAAGRGRSDKEQAVVKPAAANPIFDQETQLISPRTGVASTKLDEPAKATTRIGAAEGTGTAGAAVTENQSSPATQGPDSDSELTSVAGADRTAPKRFLSTRTLGIAASIIVLSVMGFAAYTLMSSSTQTQPAPQAAPTTTNNPVVEQAQPQPPIIIEGEKDAAPSASVPEPGAGAPESKSGKRVIIIKGKPEAQGKHTRPNDSGEDEADIPDPDEVPLPPRRAAPFPDDPRLAGTIWENEVRRARETQRKALEERRKALRIQRDFERQQQIQRDQELKRIRALETARRNTQVTTP
ncbi:MAG TPA: protein kinase [Pyrinomonadaceae bacterium]